MAPRRAAPRRPRKEEESGIPSLIVDIFVYNALVFSFIISVVAVILARASRITLKRTKKVLIGITIVGIVIIIGTTRSLTTPVASPEACLHVHRKANARAGRPELMDIHRSLERDIDITNCPSAAIGDYRHCLRNNLNHSQAEGQLAYDSKDAMRFFWELRPRLLEPRPRSSIFNLLTSDKPSFNISRLSPTQREGLVLWSKCTYPPFRQTLTQPLNLSCPFQAFNLLFFHNTLGDGQMFHPTESINSDPPPKHIDLALQTSLFVSIPQEQFADRVCAPRILHIGATPLLKTTPVRIEHTARNLAKTLSQLLHEMLHVTQYMYTCPICYSDQCRVLPNKYSDFDGFKDGQMWLPLLVAIDLMLAKEGVLEIPGVGWREHRLNLHADLVAAAMKNPKVDAHISSELNGEEWGYEVSWEKAILSEASVRHLVDLSADGILDSRFPSSRSHPAPFVVA